MSQLYPCLLLLLLGLASGSEISAQKISVGLHHASILTKANFEPTIFATTGSFGEIYATSTQKRLFAGRSRGMELLVQLNNQNAIGVGMADWVKGYSSKFDYNYGNLNQTPDQLPDGFGGMSYIVQYDSKAVNLIYKRFIQRRKLKHIIVLQPGLDVYKVATGRNYIVRANSGHISVGCCTRTYAAPTDKDANRFFFYLKRKAIRINLNLEYGVELFAMANAHFQIYAIGGYTSRPIDSSNSLFSVIPKGDIIHLGLKFQVGYAF